MTEQMTGVVEAVRKDRRGIKVGDDWYSAYNPSQLNDVEKGDSVKFDYTVKGNFNNIKGAVTKTDGVPNNNSGSGGKKSYSRGNFPIDPLDGQRSIIRQNALTNARELWAAAYVDRDENIDLVIDSIIYAARRFEAYTAGDLDRQKAQEMANALDAEE